MAIFRHLVHKTFHMYRKSATSTSRKFLALSNSSHVAPYRCLMVNDELQRACYFDQQAAAADSDRESCEGSNPLWLGTNPDYEEVSRAWRRKLHFTCCGSAVKLKGLCFVLACSLDPPRKGL
eukprot:4464251-Amphidinium_carterae.1